MLKGLLFLVVFILILITIVVMIVGRSVYLLIKRMKQMRNEAFGDEELHDFSRRKRQQYSYNGHTGHDRRENNTGTSSSDNTETTSSRQNASSESAEETSGKEVLIDMRDPQKRGRKIIDSDEGEYVDFKCD